MHCIAPPEQLLAMYPHSDNDGAFVMNFCPSDETIACETIYIMHTVIENEWTYLSYWWGPDQTGSSERMAISLMVNSRIKTERVANLPIGVAESGVFLEGTGRLNINTYTYKNENLTNRKLKRKRKQKRNGWGHLRGGASRPSRRLPRFRLCFRFRFNFRFFKILVLYVYVLIFNCPVLDLITQNSPACPKLSERVPNTSQTRPKAESK